MWPLSSLYRIRWPECKNKTYNDPGSDRAPPPPKKVSICAVFTTLKLQSNHLKKVDFKRKKYSSLFQVLFSTPGNNRGRASYSGCKMASNDTLRLLRSPFGVECRWSGVETPNTCQNHPTSAATRNLWTHVPMPEISHFLQMWRPFICFTNQFIFSCDLFCLFHFCLKKKIK